MRLKMREANQRTFTRVSAVEGSKGVVVVLAGRTTGGCVGFDIWTERCCITARVCDAINICIPESGGSSRLYDSMRKAVRTAEKRPACRGSINNVVGVKATDNARIPGVCPRPPSYP